MPRWRAQALPGHALPCAILKIPTFRWRVLAAWGPGLLVALADTDVGNIVTAAQSGATWGYRLLLPVLLLIPLLYLVQELTVRLGVHTGKGLNELIRLRHGRVWSWVSLAVLAIATLGSLITEFSGVAAVGELYGVARPVSLSLAAATLYAVVLSGSYRRMERIAIVLGLFELAFFVVAWKAHPSVQVLRAEVADIPWGNANFLYLASALIGSVFNPWMMYYQQSAVADKGLGPADYVAEKWDTAFGAVLAQLVTAAVLVALAATRNSQGEAHAIQTIGDVSAALVPGFGDRGAHLVFSLGVMGAAMVAAIVSSLALSWGISEAAGFQRTEPGTESRWFYLGYGVCVGGSALIVGWQTNLVGLDVLTQVVNTFMLPLLIGVLLHLVQTTLPAHLRLRGTYLWTLIALALLICSAGVYGGLSPLL